MDSHLLSESDALFPTFTGLFGLSTLLLSVRDEVILPPQPLEGRFQIGASRLLSSLMKGSLSGICVALLPGVGASSAAVLFNLSQKEKTLIDEGRGVREFIVSVCGVGTANAIYALVALYVIDKPRSGAVVAVRTVMGKVTAHDFFLLLSVILLVSGASVFIMLALSRIALRQVYRFDYRTMCISIVIMLLLLVTYFTGMTGLLVCIVGICIGVLPPLLGIKRSHCMGVLLVPVILWYGGFE
jgi:putative membrane protein